MTRGQRTDLRGDEMGAVAQVGGIHAVGQPRHAPGQLARDLDVVPLQPVQRAHPEARAHLEERELALGERSDGAGQEGAAGGPAVQLGEELCVRRHRRVIVRLFVVPLTLSSAQAANVLTRFVILRQEDLRIGAQEIIRFVGVLQVIHGVAAGMTAGVAAVAAGMTANVTAVASVTAVAAGTRGTVDSQFIFHLVIFGPNVPHPGHSLSMSVAVDLNRSNTYMHGGIWRTMRCRLCINCKGTGRGRGVSIEPSPHIHSQAGFLTINAKTTMHCSPDSSMLTCNTTRKASKPLRCENIFFSSRYLKIYCTHAFAILPIPLN
jgi:hypothetical protein